MRMTEMKVRTLTLGKQHDQKIVGKCKEYGISFSEMMRRIIDKYFDEAKDKNVNS